MEPARLAATDLACRRGERLLFRGLSFALSAGEALQVVGPNGTGKSSLLRILAGLLRPFAGTVERNRRGGAARRAAGARRALAARHGAGVLGADRWRRLRRRAAGRARARRRCSTCRCASSRPASASARRSCCRTRGRPGCGCSTSRSTGSTREAAAAFQQQVAGYLARGGIAVIASHQPFAVPGLQRLALADFAP